MSDGASEKPIKVTDRRMFTADGQLRDEFRHLEDAEPRSSAPEPSAPPELGGPPILDSPSPPSGAGGLEMPPGAAAPPPSRPEPARPASPSADAATPGGDEPDALGDGPTPGVQDLVALLADSAAAYLQNARYVEGASEYLEMARLHIELLRVLKDKTAGNLTSSEARILDDALHQLRLAYVEVRG